MRKFAKLFNTKERGQIAVIAQSNDDGNPEIRFFVMPEGLGVCSLAMSFKDTDAGWDLMEEAFGKIDEDRAISITNDVFEQFGENENA